MLSLLVVAALSLAQESNGTPSAAAGAQAFQDCVRDSSEGKLPQGTVRYRDELFRSSIQACAIAIYADPVQDPAVAAVRYTQTYIETLGLLNSLPRPKAEERAAMIVSVPSGRPAAPAAKLDPLMREDFSTLYWPWLGCLAAVLSKDAAVRPDDAIATAHEECTEVTAVADNEAIRLLTAAGQYGDGERQRAILDEFKSTVSQLAILGELRSRGEALGAALKRSEGATQ
jgi:hypothetical protein